MFSDKIMSLIINFDSYQPILGEKELKLTLMKNQVFLTSPCPLLFYVSLFKFAEAIQFESGCF